MKRKKTVFLSLAEVVEIHNDQIQKYGGQDGIRDMNLLSSAVTMPYASFSGSFFHSNIFEMASAYAFHNISKPSFYRRQQKDCPCICISISRVKRNHHR